MNTHLHVLKGCSPVPLANYLKALGILRLVGEQADPQARGWWEGEQFCLLTKLSKEKLEAFFLEHYAPTPLLSPWNKGCGFFKENDPGLAPLETSTAIRFALFRQGIEAARKMIDEISRADAVIRSIKARTKTNVKGFQTETQRALLKDSEAFRECVSLLKVQLAKPNIDQDKRAKLESEVAVINSIVSSPPNLKPPSKSEANKLKDSDGYKRLLAAADRRFKSLKTTLIPDCRRAWRGPLAQWIAAAVVLTEDGVAEWPSLLGTGGNDGNLDFTNNFMQQIGSLFDLASQKGNATPSAKQLLGEALWALSANQMKPDAIGQYQPGTAGGANSSTGFEDGNLVNSWDFVLMMEGTIIFISRATRRLDPVTSSRASAPFSLRPHAAGFTTPGMEKAQRGEQWMPIWHQPATLHDISALFGEARIQIDRHTATRPIEVARAVSRLGVARGIASFIRYGYLERNGQSTLAVPLGRIAVQQHPLAHLVDDLSGWMNSIERHSRDKNSPGRLAGAERRLADAVFAALTHDHTADRWQAILLAAADIEAIQATGSAIDAGPIPSLRPEWVAAVDDGSPEVRLALALGSAAAAYAKGRPIDPVRFHWLPLEPNARRFKKSDKRLVNDARVIATGRDPVRDLAALVERRLIESGMKGHRESRLVAARGCGARLDDLAQFLEGSLDIDKLAGLARAFMAIRWNRWHQDGPSPLFSGRIPDEPWLAIRLANLPGNWINDQHIPAEPRIVRLLMSGDSSRAIDIACSRLHSVGIRPPLQAGMTDAATARLWAAALAFPIDWKTANMIAQLLDPRLKPKKGLLHA